MSATQLVRYADRGFRAYDMALKCFLKYLIDTAERSGDEHDPWLSQAISNWRVWAVISDFGFTLDEHWSVEQRQMLVPQIKQAIAHSSQNGLLRAPASKFPWRYATSPLHWLEEKRLIGKLRSAVERLHTIEREAHRLEGSC